MNVSALDGILIFILIFVVGILYYIFSALFAVVSFLKPAFFVAGILFCIGYTVKASGVLNKELPLLYRIPSSIIILARAALVAFFLLNVFKAFSMNVAEGHPILAVFNIIGDLLVFFVIFFVVMAADFGIHLRSLTIPKERGAMLLISSCITTAVNTAVTAGVFIVIRHLIVRYFYGCSEQLLSWSPEILKALFGTGIL